MIEDAERRAEDVGNTLDTCVPKDNKGFWIRVFKTNRDDTSPVR